MTPSRPYLLRAIHEWILDNNLTPYLLVDAEVENVEIPRRYVENGKIVLNTSPEAVRNLSLENDWVSFTARFSGQAMQVFVPMAAVLAVYAKENGKGMFFQPEDFSHHDGEALKPQDQPPPKPKKPMLKVVK